MKNPGTRYTLTGNFKNNEPSGVMIYKSKKCKAIQCFKDGVRFGRGTTYSKDGTIRNVFFSDRESGSTGLYKIITKTPEKAFYDRKGKGIKAYAVNHLDFV